MLFPESLIECVLLKRYHRFLTDIELTDSKEFQTAHCTNTGSMKGVLHPPQRAWILKSNNPKRKLPYTLEILESSNTLVGVNTHRTNYIALEGIQKGIIPELQDLESLQMEKKYGKNSRIDILGRDHMGKEVYIEVKNVSLSEGSLALFPDSITERGTKHLHELMEVVKNGHRAVMLFVAQRGDVDTFSPAEAIDPVYSSTLKEAQNQGVELYAYNCTLTPHEITLKKKLNILLT